MQKGALHYLKNNARKDIDTVVVEYAKAPPTGPSGPEGPPGNIKLGGKKRGFGTPCGKPLKRKTEVMRKRAEHGKASHHAYASIYASLAGFRFTLAVQPVLSRKNAALINVVLAPVRKAKWCGIRIWCLLLDREFCSVPMQVALQARRLPCCMSVILPPPDSEDLRSPSP